MGKGRTKADRLDLPMMCAYDSPTCSTRICVHFTLSRAQLWPVWSLLVTLNVRYRVFTSV